MNKLARISLAIALPISVILSFYLGDYRFDSVPNNLLCIVVIWFAFFMGATCPLFDRD
jgi:hypothetical protein